MSTTDFELRPILITWEKLRIVYNLVLAGVVGLFVILEPEVLSVPYLPFRLVAAAIGANVCFTAGPVVDAYVSYLAKRRIPLTWFLFIPGLVFAVLLAFATMLSYMWGPD
jgi:hypothetical protein